MSNIFAFKGIKPIIDASAFIHPNATVSGHVTIGRDVYVGPGAALRGDWGEIVIADGCNIQENCTVHMFPGIKVSFGVNCHIGHGAVIHGATLGENILIGMNAVVMDNVQIGNGSIIGALTFVPTDMIIPERSLLVGNPAKIIKEVSDEMLAWKSEGTKLYQTLATECQSELQPCEPLREMQERPQIDQVYKTWQQTKDDLA